MSRRKSASAAVDPTGVAEIAEGVWVIPDRRVPLVPNVGVVVGDDAALVVDTGMGPASGRSCSRRRARRPVRGGCC